MDQDQQHVVAAQDDPNLAGVATVAELRARLRQLSDACAAADAADHGSAFRQLTFDGLHPNPCFEPNRFKADVGCDGRKITTYYR